jgi:hypothetical protein
MQDRPTYAELLEAVQHFLETDVVPALDGPKKFHARVAANVVAIVRRELQTEEEQLQGEWERLRTLLQAEEPRAAGREALRHQVRSWTKRLCERIRAGDADAGPWRAGVVAHLRHTVNDKLAVANPKYLAAELADRNTPVDTSKRP